MPDSGNWRKENASARSQRGRARPTEPTMLPETAMHATAFPYAAPSPMQQVQPPRESSCRAATSARTPTPVISISAVYAIIAPIVQITAPANVANSNLAT
jgi:hypothetical protein